MKRMMVFKKNNRMYLSGFLLLILLLWGWGTAAPASDMQLETEYVEMHDADGTALFKAKVSSGKGRSIISDWSYGMQLTENQMAIYSALAQTDNMLDKKPGGGRADKVDVKLETPYIYPEGTLFDKEDKGKDNYYTNTDVHKQLTSDYTRACHAYLKDYPEQYWIKSFVVSYVAPSEKAPRITELYLAPTDYYNSSTPGNETAYGNIREEVPDTNAAFKNLLASIEGGSRYETVKQIHDKITELVIYPTGTPEMPYYHTITGGLLEKYGHKGVCECYSKLFHMLCQEKGIPSILITGGSTLNADGTVNANHMWNYVLMDDLQWYLVDCTWDDSKTGPAMTTYFLSGSDTTVSNHRPVGIFGGSYTAFSLPEIARNSYQQNHPDLIAEEDITKLSFEKQKYALKCGGKQVLTVQTEPLAGSRSNLIWEVSDPEVLSVEGREDKAVLAAKKPGTVTIKVMNVKNRLVWAQCIVQVVHDPGAAAACTTPQICKGCKTVLKKAAGHKPGNWTVVKKATGTAQGQEARKCTVCKKVMYTRPIARLTVSLNLKELPLQVKRSTAVLKISKRAAGDSIKEWKSSNPQIVTVNKTSGKLTAKKAGRATVTLVMRSGASASCVVKVQKGAVRTKKLTLTQKAATLAPKKTLIIKPEKYPLTSTDKITFTSSNKKVAAVSSGGKITAKKKGTATITAKSGSKKVSIRITVK